MTVLRTERLILREWRASDREPFAALNDDPEVMRHFPQHLSRAESFAMVDRIEAAIDEHGWGLWAAEVPGVADFIGFIGLAIPRFDAPFMPTVEVGWRLQRSAWGHGYATEGATASLDFAFGALGLDEVVSMTIPANTRSRAVMERLGMTRDLDGDFEHPLIADGNPCRRHVLYRLSASQWRGR